MKKGFAGFLTVVMAASIIGCSSGNNAVIPSSKAPAAASEAAPAEVSKAPEVAAWIPKTEIEFVVPSAAGGGSDINARTVADIAFKNGFTPKNFKVNNMPGGAGAVAYSYLAGKKGQDGIVAVLHSGQIMSTLVNKSPVTSDMLTYLPCVAFDNLTICVTKDSPYKDIESLISASKEKPGEIKFGGSQRGNSDHLALEMLNKYTDTVGNFVAFDSNGEAMTSLLGGHLDASFFNPSECIGQVEAGEIIPLVTYTTNRMGGQFKDVRTFTELGYPELVLREVRGFLAPPDISPEAIAFYDDVVKKVTETDEWKTNYIEKFYLEPVYMDSAEAKVFFENEIQNYIKIFKEVGVME